MQNLYLLYLRLTSSFWLILCYFWYRLVLLLGDERDLKFERQYLKALNDHKKAIELLKK